MRNVVIGFTAALFLIVMLSAQNKILNKFLVIKPAKPIATAIVHSDASVIKYINKGYQVQHYSKILNRYENDFSLSVVMVKY